MGVPGHRRCLTASWYCTSSSSVGVSCSYCLYLCRNTNFSLTLQSGTVCWCDWNNVCSVPLLHVVKPMWLYFGWCKNWKGFSGRDEEAQDEGAKGISWCDKNPPKNGSNWWWKGKLAAAQFLGYLLSTRRDNSLGESTNYCQSLYELGMYASCCNSISAEQQLVEWGNDN